MNYISSSYDFIKDNIWPNPEIPAEKLADKCVVCLTDLTTKTVVAHLVHKKYQCFIHEECLKDWIESSKKIECLNCAKKIDPSALTPDISVSEWFDKLLKKIKWYVGPAAVSSAIIMGISLLVIKHFNPITRGTRGTPPFQLFINKYDVFFEGRYKNLTERFGGTMLSGSPTEAHFEDYLSKLRLEIDFDIKALYNAAETCVINASYLIGFAVARNVNDFYESSLKGRIFNLSFLMTSVAIGTYMHHDAAIDINDMIIGLTLAQAGAVGGLGAYTFKKVEQWLFPKPVWTRVYSQ